MTDIVKNIQKVAMASIENTKPMNVTFGEVRSTSPLRVIVDQKLELTEDFLLLTRNVMDYDLEMTVDHQTENSAGGSGDASYASHSHAYTGRKTFRIHNALVTGDIVVMLRDNGGQRYVIIDKVVR